MQLKSIVFKGLGPFFDAQCLEVDSRVTVLTGANDVGKTLILDGIRRLYEIDADITEHVVNVDHRQRTTALWRQDQSIGCSATFVVTDASMISGGATLEANDEITVEARFAPEARSRNMTEARRAGGRIRNAGTIRRFPKLVAIPNESIRNEIELGSPTPVELALLRIAFGSGFSHANLKALDDLICSSEVSNAEERLTKELQDIMPRGIQLRIRLQPLMGQKEKLGAFVIDEHRGHVPIRSRGAGIQRILAILVHLRAHADSGAPCMVLLDEPENSLHADAQHSVRTFLEALGDKQNIQIIYATHSPAMINTMRPHTVRLVHRTRAEGVALSKIDNAPIRKNYISLRSSLGISPADSLLYAPVTVVVEGESEVVGLPLAFRRLQDAGVPEFRYADRALSQCHILDGMGDSFELMCRMAKSQGARVVIFVDGDKIRRVRQQDVAGCHQDVPVIHLAEGMEFEQLLAPSLYFKALAELAELDDSTCSESAFQEWEQREALPPKMLFSKRIQRWLDKIAPTFAYRKPLVMRDAILKAEPHQIATQELGQLLQAVQNFLR